MSAYYNENDPFAAAWLRALIADNQIAQGDVDERSIADVAPSDLHGYTQCHFFAGIGGWSYALRLAGWPDDRACWTGSCPCQPFSAVGAGLGFDDPRHLWPQWFRLLRVHRPVVCFGEQVDKALAWLDLVSETWRVKATPSGRLLWAHTASRRRIDGNGYTGWPTPNAQDEPNGGPGQGIDRLPACAAAAWPSPMARHSRPEGIQRSGEQRFEPEDGGAVCRMADSPVPRRPRTWEHDGGSPSLPARPAEHGVVGHSDPARPQGRLLRRNGSGELASGKGSVVDELGYAKHAERGTKCEICDYSLGGIDLEGPAISLVLLRMALVS